MTTKIHNQYFLWLLFAIAKIRKSSKGTAYVDETISGRMSINIAESFSKLAMAVGILHLGSDSGRMYITEGKTKNVDKFELQDYLRKLLHMT